uniref:DNA/RNA-binding protein Alba-like domain-containing protein n=1 Tax=Strombidium inclinatum TaxID=197538 RepID=A0A7S3N0X9_9SPIT
MNEGTTAGQKKTHGGPENSNHINVSVKKNPNFYVFIGKKYLLDHETIELQALGNAVSTSVIAAENLVRNNYAEFAEIKTKTIIVQGQRGDSKKAKLFITLKRSKDFFENMKKFEEIRTQNELLKEKNAKTPTEETKEEKAD